MGGGFGEDSGVEAKEPIEPFFDVVACGVANGSVKLDFTKSMCFWSRFVARLLGG